MGELNDKVKELERQLAEMKTALPTPIDHAAAARFKDEMHQLAERRASAHNAFSRADLEDMERACPTSTARAIVSDNRGGVGPRSAAAMPASATPAPVVTSGSGWAHEVELTNPPGVAQADRLMDEADRRDRLALIEEKAKQQAFLKATEPK
jgi:hypothetical protein